MEIPLGDHPTANRGPASPATEKSHSADRQAQPQRLSHKSREYYLLDLLPAVIENCTKTGEMRPKRDAPKLKKSGAKAASAAER